ncbi:hypothetical protein OBBRIDRAFT_456884 [Obba rivulosa]|uniref:Uncharacterized protein n=1 Tax=Obba rivulosa TaxID=1052685 RepID=A0A8E2B5J0_9APHY|nr:hypothetical protein OBBRIDRAFT_456884 [Obba rivulosa]
MLVFVRICAISSQAVHSAHLLRSVLLPCSLAILGIGMHFASKIYRTRDSQGGRVEFESSDPNSSVEPCDHIPKKFMWASGHCGNLSFLGKVSCELFARAQFRYAGDGRR